MHKPITVLTAFVIEKLDTEPIAKRIEIYRALAAAAPNKAEEARFLSLADELVAHERRHEQLKLDFLRRAL